MKGFLPQGKKIVPSGRKYARNEKKSAPPKLVEEIKSVPEEKNLQHTSGYSYE